jgi:hypothetical protein
MGRPTRRHFWVMQFSCEHISAYICEFFSATPCEKRERGANLTVGEIFLIPSETNKRNLKLGVPSFLPYLKYKKGRKEPQKRKEGSLIHEKELIQ